MSTTKIKNKTSLILVVDNTLTSEINLLQDKQKQYINAKIKLQEERKLIDKLLKQYEDIIISTEDKLTKIIRRVKNVKDRTREVKYFRGSGGKTKKTIS
jgi:hypothetical protein|tara:strand:+ start:920 stop:1216 length:297 start_codon:yes stop_codon:yes gene_type:complete